MGVETPRNPERAETSWKREKCRANYNTSDIIYQKEDAPNWTLLKEVCRLKARRGAWFESIKF
jgi:hypothetical protein